MSTDIRIVARRKCNVAISKFSRTILAAPIETLGTLADTLREDIVRKKIGETAVANTSINFRDSRATVIENLRRESVIQMIRPKNIRQIFLIRFSTKP